MRTDVETLIFGGAIVLAGACGGSAGSGSAGGGGLSGGGTSPGGETGMSGGNGDDTGGSDDGAGADAGADAGDDGPGDDGDGPAGNLDCPTVEAPPYTRGVDVTLSQPFALSCGSCHGATGSGFAQYPAIPGDLSLEQFKSVVREGRGLMASFGADFISDAELEADYAALTALANGADADLNSSEGEFDWTEEQVENAYTRGMKAWRTPDSHGAACASCHSPDAIDLAFIGYEDGTILRRAGLHISPEDSAAVVDLIHAQRRRFGIERPCSTDWHVLQPGGKVLPGDTPQEQDTAFAQQLVDMDLFVVTGAVETLEDAHAAYEEFVSIDLRKLPIGIELPRWTEDGFNGEEHSTINDYIPAIGRAPNDPDQWYALEDAYLADPSDENLLALIDQLGSGTNDLGYAEANYDANRQASGRCGPIGDEGGFLGFTDFNKKESVLLVQHYMRQATQQESGWPDETLAPFVEYRAPLNPFYHIGARFAEQNCRDAGPMMASWPEDAAEEIPASDLASGEAIELSRQLNHPWQTLGQIYDPALMMREDQNENQLHYWALHGFSQRDVHLPFYYGHRVAQQVYFYEELRGTDLHPGDIGHFAAAPVHPLLDADRLMMRPVGFRSHTEGTDLRAQVSNSLKCNIVRMLVLMQKEQFEAGETGNALVDKEQNWPMVQHYDTWQKVADRFGSENPAASLYGDLAAQPGLCTGDLSSLLDEMIDLAESAPEYN